MYGLDEATDAFFYGHHDRDTVCESREFEIGKSDEIESQVSIDSHCLSFSPTNELTRTLMLKIRVEKKPIVLVTSTEVTGPSTSVTQHESAVHPGEDCVRLESNTIHG